MTYGADYRADFAPEWVVIGVPSPKGGVVVYASRELTYAQLRVEAIVPSWPTQVFAAIEPQERKIELEVGMRSYVWTAAPTYGEAMRNLAQHWDPDPPPRSQPTHHSLTQIASLGPGKTVEPRDEPRC